MLNTELLLDRMGAMGYTCKDVADKIGVSKNTFTSILKHKRHLNNLEIDALCDVLKITSAETKCNIFLS